VSFKGFTMTTENVSAFTFILYITHISINPTQILDAFPLAMLNTIFLPPV